MLRDEGIAQGPHSECAMSGYLLDSCPGLLTVPHLTSLCPQQPDSGAQGLCRNWTPGPFLGSSRRRQAPLQCSAERSHQGIQGEVQA